VKAAEDKVSGANVLADSIHCVNSEVQKMAQPVYTDLDKRAFYVSLASMLYGLYASDADNQKSMKSSVNKPLAASVMMFERGLAQLEAVPAEIWSALNKLVAKESPPLTVHQELERLTKNAQDACVRYSIDVERVKAGF